MASKSSSNQGMRSRILTYGAAARNTDLTSNHPSSKSAGSRFDSHRPQPHSLSSRNPANISGATMPINPAGSAILAEQPDITEMARKTSIKKRKHNIAFEGDLKRDTNALQVVDSRLQSDESIDKVQKRHLASTQVEHRSKKDAIMLASPSSTTQTDEKTRKTESLSKCIRKPRLIDALAAQRARTPDSSSEDESQRREQGIPQLTAPRSPTFTGSQVHTPERRHLTTSKSSKIKMTYSQSRGITLASRKLKNAAKTTESQNDDDTTSDTDIFATPTSPPKHDDDLEDEVKTGVGIRSVHELRRAGANNRFSDEMDDLLSRISTPSMSPSTMRRNALCELVQKLSTQEFARQFRDYGARDNIVKSISIEKDPISGFMLVVALVIFLSSGPAPHLLRQLSIEKIGMLLNRLLQITDDISFIASQRHMNVSRSTRSSVDRIKSSVKRMGIWHDFTITNLSPRTVSLQLIDILSHCSSPAELEQLTGDSSEGLSLVATFCSREGSQEDVDYYLIVSILEAYSNLGIPTTDSTTPTIAQFLERALVEHRDESTDLDRLVLKLSINVVNNASSAASFNKISVFSTLSVSISLAFGSVSKAVDAGQFSNAQYDELLLLLGIMINTLEHCPVARESVDEKSLGILSTIWLNNVSFLNEADSVGKSKLSVAFGYLAIILGYLFLTTSNRLQMRSYHNWPGNQSLINAIQEFLNIYRSTNSRMEEAELLVQELRRLGNK